MMHYDEPEFQRLIFDRANCLVKENKSYYLLAVCVLEFLPDFKIQALVKMRLKFLIKFQFFVRIM